MEKSKPQNVDTYILNAVPEACSIMEKLRALIKSTVPDASEEISWNVPIYKYHGILAGFSVAKHHVSLGVDVLSEHNREALKIEGYKTGKKTIQIKFDQKVPAALLKGIIKEQARVNEAK